MPVGVKSDRKNRTNSFETNISEGDITDQK